MQCPSSLVNILLQTLLYASPSLIYYTSKFLQYDEEEITNRDIWNQATYVINYKIHIQLNNFVFPFW